MKYLDVHCHVQFDAYDADREEVAARMVEHEIGGIVVGCDAASSRAAADFAHKREGFWASVGQHPNHDADEEFDEHMYRNLLMYPSVVAIGECGLDYFRPTEVTDDVKKKQRELFLRHVRLAGQTKRPLIVHARPSKGSMDAYHDAMDVIEEEKKQFPALTGDFHFFVGDERTAKRAFGLDFTVSFTAVITFTHDYDEVIKNAPLDRILTETDSPYVAPASKRGQRNEPTAVIDVVRRIAEIRGEDEEVIREAMLQNAIRLFGLDTPAF